MHDFGPWEEAGVTGDPQKHRVMRGDGKWMEKVNMNENLYKHKQGVWEDFPILLEVPPLPL